MTERIPLVPDADNAAVGKSDALRAISKVVFFLEMEITVNNQIKQITDNKLSSVILSILGDKTKGVAVAVNSSVVPKTDWEKTRLREKDSVMIIRATQGG